MSEIPKGWKLVPAEATDEMMQAAWDIGNTLHGTPEGDDPLPRHQYRAMLDAAPVAAQEPGWQLDALRNALEFMLDRFERRDGNLFSQRLACSKARDAIAAVSAAQPAPAQGEPDTDPDASWLSLAHMICADAGIPPGHIMARLAGELKQEAKE